MWISRKHYEAEILRLTQTVDWQADRGDKVYVAWERYIAQQAARAEALQAEINSLRERLIEAAGDARAAQAQASIVTAQLNIVASERAELLKIVIPMMQGRVVQIGAAREVVSPVGVSFEDLGENAGAEPSDGLVPMQGLSDSIFRDPDEQIEPGLPGSVFRDPNLA